MSFKKLLNFLSTERGKSYTLAGVTITGISLFSANFLPQTILLTKYKEIIQSYQAGLERKVPDKVIHRFDRAVEILDVPLHERKFLKPFTVYGFDCLSAGSTKFKFGSLIGVPVNYSYDSDKDIERNDIKIRNEQIKWFSENGKVLQTSIVLTEDEQVFGIAKTILEAQSYRVLLNSVYPAATLTFIYTIGHYVNIRLDLFQRPMAVRCVLYSLLGLFGFGIWSFLKDFTQVYYDTQADKELCSAGPEMIDAGIRFYDKLLKKNIAIRGLTGDDTYTARGNENFLIRQKRLPLTVRKSYFEMRKKELENSEKSEKSEEETVAV